MAYLVTNWHVCPGSQAWLWLPAHCLQLLCMCAVQQIDEQPDLLPTCLLLNCCTCFSHLHMSCMHCVYVCCVFNHAGSPIPYESLRSYFKNDPASSWGAYVAGCLLVLAREKGLSYPDGISILVCSDVPEGEPLSHANCAAAPIVPMLRRVNCTATSRALLVAPHSVLQHA